MNIYNIMLFLCNILSCCIQSKKRLSRYLIEKSVPQGLGPCTLRFFCCLLHTEPILEVFLEYHGVFENLKRSNSLDRQITSTLPYFLVFFSFFSNQWLLRQTALIVHIKP